MADRNVRRPLSAWQVAQRYVAESPVLRFDADQILGWIRSRSTAKLATCSTRLDLHKIIIGDAPELKALLQVEAFVKKNVDLASNDTDSVALSNFLLAEQQCRITNRRLNHYLCNAYRHRLDADVSLKVEKAQRTLAYILGDFSKFIGELPRYIRFTGGATATRPRKFSHPTFKMRKNCICTAGASPYVKALWRYFALPGEARPRTVEWNRVLFVPKNFKTARTIAGEPDGNMPLQLAFDTYAKIRLRRVGQNLSDQRRNQEAARIGSIDGSISTIDFSMASDTVSVSTVWALFPYEFARYLVDVRSHYGKLPDGSIVRYAKLSSMGNGSTFAVETLCFYALACAVGSKKCNVYGDDVTIETELVEPFVKLARFFGFTVNTEKSFSSGLFRESCGKFYVGGIDVSPHFLRSNVCRPANVSLLINGLVQRGASLGLIRYLLGLYPDIRIVPWNSDPTSGVFVSPAYAEGRGLLYESSEGSRYGPFVSCFKGYCRKASNAQVSRQHSAYWLWHFRTANRIEEVDDPVETSSLTLSQCGSRTRESIWREPEGMLPDFTVLEVLLLALTG